MKKVYYNSIEQCKQHKNHKTCHTQINNRYKFYNQTFFTAGDVEQFYQKIKHYNKEINNTFLYLFHKFKKGIFVVIKNNKVDCFLPFSKKNYINEWSHLIRIDQKYSNFSNSKYSKNLDGLMSYISKMTGYKKTKYISNIDQWYANNCIIRNEYPIYEGESGVLEIKDMLDNLCLNKKIKDVYFFINKRDFPLLTNNNTEPYDYIFGNHTPLISHNYANHATILSMCSNNRFKDIPIPTWEDWCRISSKHNKFFPRNPRNYNYTMELNWNNKKNIAVFRGSSTGGGINSHTNMRLKLHTMKNNLLDVGITKWNLRPRLVSKNNTVYLDTINKNEYPPLVDCLTPEQQSHYKYIINIDGHSSAFRLSTEMSMGSVILLVESKYSLWYTKYLKEYIHYIPIKHDLSDLEEKLDWCIQHDEKCKEIALNTLHFYNQYLSEKNIYNELENIINNIPVKPLQPIYNNFNYDCNLSSNDFVITNLSITRNHYSQYIFSKFIQQQHSIDKNIFDCHKTIKNIDYLSVNNINFIRKNNNNLYEGLIGKQFINNLYFKIPNFMYTYHYQNDYIYLEHIKGIEFQEWLKNDFDFNQYIFILLQIYLSIYVAQNDFDFIHGDLSPWNIILYELPIATEIFYQIKHTHQFIKIKTKLIPIIIDFGKSSTSSHHIFSIHSTSNFMFDICSILIKSINTILTNNINYSDEKSLLSLINFFKNTPYIPYPIQNFYTLRKFSRTRSKFDNLYLANEINISPFNFIEFIINNFNCNTIIIENHCFNFIDPIIQHQYTYVDGIKFNNLDIKSLPIHSDIVECIFNYLKIIDILLILKSPVIIIQKVHDFYQSHINTAHFNNHIFSHYKLFKCISSPFISLNIKKKLSIL